jgi:transposase
MAQTSTLIAGIDTAKDKLDVAIHGQDGGLTVENTAAGWRKLAQQLAAAAVTRVGIEATGGYERGVTRALQKAGFTVVVLQPLQVRAFARMRLQRAKNDRIDAALIAACTHLLDAQSRTPREPRFDGLADQLVFIEQVEADVTRLKTRLEHVSDTRLRGIYERDIARLQKRADREIARLIRALREHPDLAQRFDLVCSIPGCGERTALAIVVYMPELGQVSREAVAALAGLAPFVHQSGEHQGESRIGGGRKRLRGSLYKAALPAASFWNPALKALYGRLRERGKPHTCALVACARKLLIFANTVVARGTPWQASAAHA